MDVKKLEELLSQEEGVALEFKEQLDLDSHEGKGKFLKDLLALANSPTSQSFLIIGIEDKSKKPIGLSRITEEQLQQIVSHYCRPPIDFDFHVVEYQGALVGVIQLFHRYPFHTLKETYTYQSNGKNISIREKAVFIRRGSTIDEATPDEVVDMAQSDALDMKAVVSGLDKIADQLGEVAYNIEGQHQDMRPAEEIDRYIETTFVAMLTGLITAWLWQPEVLWMPLLILPVTFIFMVIGSAVRLLHFGILRAVFTSLLISAILGGLFVYGPSIALGEYLIFSDLTLRVIFGLFAGAISGIAGQLIIWSVERKMR
jgi:hypothetical protein